MTFRKNKILFILKRRDNHGDYDCQDFTSSTNLPSTKLTSGLFNSASFVVDMLSKSGILCNLVEVTDNNDIDREVAKFKPTHVIIEGLWVVPEKFEILSKLHPTVQWLIRIHSEIPFLSMEGIAVEWIIKYMNYKSVVIACNSPRTTKDLRHLIAAYHENWNNYLLEQKIILLPNFYPCTSKHISNIDDDRHRPINIGCFGAVRPLKNQLIQGIAALKYAKKHNRRLNFHMNGTRNEQGGGNNFKNISSLFDGEHNKLITYPWMPHLEFLNVVRQMDVSLCVSFSETFCIVAADSVNERIPLVASSEIPWCSPFSHAKPTDVDSIENAIERSLCPITRHIFIAINHKKLADYCENTQNTWIEYFSMH
jgi:hypothetical protein